MSARVENVLPLVLIGVSREAAYTKSMLGNRSARTIPTKEGA